MKVNIVGAGLTGSEAAWQLASRGVEVKIYEMRDDNRKTFAHRTKNFAELVCSNSLRSDDVKTAIGLLHQEMRMLDSLIIRSADQNKVPAGSALAVDRDGFSKFIEDELVKTGKVVIVREEIKELPVDSDEIWLIASGPLTSDSLSKSILKHSGEDNLAFFDAIAPIIYKDSINFDKAWFQSRYDKGDGSDYINCPLSKDQYYKLVDEIIKSDKSDFKDWEKDTPYFDGCLPIEVMASRGVDTLKYGPMKPVGLNNPHFINHDNPELTNKTFGEENSTKPYAIVQLRQDNKSGTLYNIVGFQTKLKYGGQARIFKMIPGLENCEFARFGGIHRNIFINSPKLLNKDLSFKNFKNIYFAGQITGVEGYVESASMGLLAGIFITNKIHNKNISPPPPSSAIGSLINYITEGHSANNFQPMNVNYGIFDKIDQKIAKQDRKTFYSNRALEALQIWKNDLGT